MVNKHDLKQATDTSLPAGAVLFGADSMTAVAPSTYPIETLAAAFNAPRALDALAYLAGSGAIVAHRTGGGVYAPENSLAAARAMLAAGIRAIEFDVYQTNTGVLACIHDSTVDRTTTASGNVVDLTESTIESAILDAAPVLGLTAGWARERIPLWHEVLREFGNRVILLPEAKNDPALKAIIAELRRYNVLPASVVIQSFSLSMAQAAAAAGYPSVYLVANPVAVDFAAVYASGVRAICSDIANWTGTLVTNAKAAGLITGCYTLTRRVSLATWLGYGGQFVFADDPIYLATSQPIDTVDRFAAQTWAPGQQANAARGAFVVPDILQIPRAGGLGYGSSLMGNLCPIKGDANVTAFNLAFKLAITAVDAADRWAGIIICATDDLAYTDSAPWLNGYHVLIRQDGRIQLYRVTSGAGATLLATASGAALTLSTTYDFTIAVTATDVTITNTTNALVCAFTDATRRGGYVHFGAQNSTARYSNVVVT